MKVYLRELTPKQMQKYAAELHTCKFCNSVELVVSNYVGDAICEDCGKWQGN